MIELPPKTGSSNYNQALKMIRATKFKNLINEINDKYLYWDKVKYQEIPDGFNHKDLWVALKITRTVDAKHLKFGKYAFSYYQTNMIQQILHEFDLNIGGNVGVNKLIPKEDKDKFLISSIMEEAIASSQMEGAVTTRKKAKEMLRKNNKPRNRSDQMILNNYRTIKYIVANKSNKLNSENLLLIHKLITNNTLEEKNDEGAFRETDDIFIVDNSRGEIVHNPPSYKEIPELMNQICEFYNNDDSGFFIHPIIKGIIMHFIIAYIHPFTDGNGRTARALFYWYLLSKGYWLTEYLSISKLIIKSKNQYEKAYLHTEKDENDLTYFLNYNLKTMVLAFDALRKYIQRKIEEKKYITNFQRIPGINERQAEILKWYYDETNVILTVKEIENTLMISNQTARTDLLKLVDLNFIEIIQVNKKKQIFVRKNGFDDILKSRLANDSTI